MNQAKFHHYVPRFYLAQFSDLDGFVWAYDKIMDKVFRGAPKNIAGENKFYDVPELRAVGIDPRYLETQFAEIESEAKNVIKSWLFQIERSNKIEIPRVNREIVSLFIVLQLLRTSEARTQIVQFTRTVGEKEIQGDNLQLNSSTLHANVLWDEELIKLMSQKLENCIWIFAKNDSEIPFVTSDHPVMIKSLDSKIWIMGPKLFDQGMYVVYPISPNLILYCKDPKHWGKLAKLDNMVSPVNFTPDMVNHENSGQIGMSRRFVFSNTSNFDFTREFCDLNPEIRDPERMRFEWILKGIE